MRDLLKSAAIGVHLEYLPVRRLQIWIQVALKNNFLVIKATNQELQ